MGNCRFSFTRKSFGAVDYNLDDCLEVFSPKILQNNINDEDLIIKKGLDNPIGTPSLVDIAKCKKDALILIDDNTRNTPAYKIAPLLIKELIKAGLYEKNIKFLVATGTHRAMTRIEKEAKLGKDLVEKFEVLDHVYDDEETILDLGRTDGGIAIHVNRLAVEADLLIGIGHIVPHRIPGFGGGGKIVQPGVCGEITTGQTHWKSALYDSHEIMGTRDNPVRKEIDDVARKLGLDFIVNVILDANGSVVGCVSGDMVEAHKKGCEISRSVFCQSTKTAADIVVSEAFPSDLDLWQAVKGLFSADCLVKRSGVIILAAGLDEGISNQHKEIEKIGYVMPEVIMQMVESVALPDLTVAAHLLHVSRIINGRAKTILVSDHLSKVRTERLGFLFASNVQEAYLMAKEMMGKEAKVAFLRNGGEMMPVVEDRRSLL